MTVPINIANLLYRRLVGTGQEISEVIGFNISPGQHFRFVTAPNGGFNVTGNGIYRLHEIFVADDMDDNVMIRFVDIDHPSGCIYDLPHLKNDTKIVILES